MSARENLHPVQFHHEPDEDKDTAAEYDGKGADDAENFGYSAEDMADYQWNRHKHDDKPEVF